MTDYFLLLDEPRRPWIDPDLLREKFLARSSELHPDRVHGGDASDKSAAQQRYMELNAAYQCLREPRERLRHLLTLEGCGAAAGEVQRVPDALMDLSLTVGRHCREADAFLAEKTRIHSPLLKVRCFEESQRLTSELQQLQQQIGERHETLLNRLRDLDEQWGSSGERPDNAHKQVLNELGDLQRLLSFHSRWSSQLQERVVRLAF